MNQNKKKIGCLGLSADPPHCGHLEIAQLVLRRNMADEVWLIPCYKHSFRKSLLAVEHRWQMTKFLERENIKADSIEISRKGNSYTIDTVKALKAKYPDCDFFWIIGSDLVKNKSFLRWKNWKELLSMVNFLVITRKGYEIKRMPPNFILVAGQISDISSTGIRERIRRGLPITGLVPPKVKEYIERHKLYKK